MGDRGFLQRPPWERPLETRGMIPKAADRGNRKVRAGGCRKKALDARAGAPWALPIAFEVHLAGLLACVFAEPFGFEVFEHFIDHTGVAAEKDVGVFRGGMEFPDRVEHAPAPEFLDVSGVAVPGGGFLGGAADDGDIGEVGAEAVHGEEFVAVAEVPGMACAVKDGEPLPGVLAQMGSEHADVGGESGARADHQEVGLGWHVVEGEETGDFGSEPEGVADAKGEETRGECARLNKHDVEFQEFACL